MSDTTPTTTTVPPKPLPKYKENYYKGLTPRQKQEKGIAIFKKELKQEFSKNLKHLNHFYKTNEMSPTLMNMIYGISPTLWKDIPSCGRSFAVGSFRVKFVISGSNRCLCLTNRVHDLEPMVLKVGEYAEKKGMY